MSLMSVLRPPVFTDRDQAVDAALADHRAASGRRDELFKQNEALSRSLAVSRRELAEAYPVSRPCASTTARR